MKRKSNVNLEDDPRFWHKVWKHMLIGNERSAYVERATELATAALPDGGIPPEEGAQFLMDFCTKKYLEAGVPDVWMHVRYMIIGAVTPNNVLTTAMEFAAENIDGGYVTSVNQRRCWLIDRALQHEAEAVKRGEKPRMFGQDEITKLGGKAVFQVATSILEYPDGRFCVLGLVAGKIHTDTGPLYNSREEAVEAADKIMAKVRSAGLSKGVSRHEHLRN